MSKRSNGEGTVRQRPNGRWEARLSYQDPVTGRQARRSFYGATAKEVRTAMKDAAKRLEAGQPAVDATVTVGEWIDRWISTTLAASNRRETTKQLSTTLLTKHVQTAGIAGIRLDRLRPSHVDGWLLELRGRAKPLADSSIQRVFRVLRVCLDDAVRDGLVAVNPMQKVDQPAAAATEARHLSPAEVASVLAAARGTRYWALFAVIAATGMRKGEACALRWADIDFDSGLLVVRGTLTRQDGKLVVAQTKTTKSRRALMPSASVMRVLREHRTTQIADRLRAADQWVDDDFVFTTELGRPLDGRNVLRAFTTAAARAGISGASVHTLRHSAATTMLDSGIHLAAVSTLLGHSGIRITADTYSHLTAPTAKAAMDGLGEVLGL